MTAIYIILTLLVLFVIYAAVLIKPNKPREFDENLLKPYAHRGLHGDGIPENSLTAFKKAADNGYGIELDLQLSKDGEVMVFHDYSLKRMTGHDANHNDLTLDELKKLRLYAFDENGTSTSTDETIPTLKEVLSAVDGRVPILVELKGESTDTSLCLKADEILRNYKGKYIIESFNPMLLRWYKLNRPKVLRGILITNICREVRTTPLNIILSSLALNCMTKPDFVAYNLDRRRFFPIQLCLKLHKPQKFTWTVKTHEMYNMAVKENAVPIFEKIRIE